MIDLKQVERLVQFRSQRSPVTSFYLNVDVSQKDKYRYTTRAKGLIKEGKEKLKSMDLKRPDDATALSSVEQDFEKIFKFIAQTRPPAGTQAMAIFSCSSEDFWQHYFLPCSVNDIVMFGVDPFVRPLTNAIDLYKPVEAILIDRAGARFYKVFLATIIEKKEIESTPPKKVKFAGWYGLQEQRVRDKFEMQLLQHLKRCAELAYSYFRAWNIEYVIIGGHKKLRASFEEILPAKMQERVIGRIQLDPQIIKEDDLIKRITKIQEQTIAEEEVEIVNDLVTQAKKGGLALTGLGKVISALNMGQIHTLIVARGHTRTAFRCLECDFIALTQQECPYCNKPLGKEPDIVDELIQAALKQGAFIRHIRNQSLFPQFNHIGAVLRFKV